LIYFPEQPGRATRERIDDAQAGLIERLAADPWVGFVLVGSETEGALVLANAGDVASSTTPSTARIRSHHSARTRPTTFGGSTRSRPSATSWSTAPSTH
jgi:hypothetical protein